MSAPGLLSLADRAAGLQLLQLSLDRDGVDVRLEASFAMAGLGMEPMRLEEDLGAWRTEGSGKGVAMTGAATLRLDGRVLEPRASVPAPLGLAVALSGRAGSKTRSARCGGTSRQTSGRSRPSSSYRSGGFGCLDRDTHLRGRGMDAAAAARLDHEHGLLYGDVARAGLKTPGGDCAARKGRAAPDQAAQRKDDAATRSVFGEAPARLTGPVEPAGGRFDQTFRHRQQGEVPRKSLGGIRP
jgi:hypothetical protein